MAMSFRPATTADHAAISRIAARSATLHARALPERYREAPDAIPADRVRELVESAASNVLVAERDGDVAGYAMMQRCETMPHPFVRPRRYALLDEIAYYERLGFETCAHRMELPLNGHPERPINQRGAQYRRSRVVPAAV